MKITRHRIFNHVSFNTTIAKHKAALKRFFKQSQCNLATEMLHIMLSWNTYTYVKEHRNLEFGFIHDSFCPINVAYQLEMVFANKPLAAQLIASSFVRSTSFTYISANVCMVCIAIWRDHKKLCIIQAQKCVSIFIFVYICILLFNSTYIYLKSFYNSYLSSLYILS